MHNMHLVNMQNVGWGTAVLGADCYIGCYHDVGWKFIRGWFCLFMQNLFEVYLVLVSGLFNG